MTKYIAWCLSVGIIIFVVVISFMQFSVFSSANMKAEYFDGHAPWDGYVPTVRIFGEKRVYQFFIADKAVNGNKNDFSSGDILPLDQLLLFTICNKTSSPNCLLEQPEGEVRLSEYKVKSHIAGQIRVKSSEGEETIQFSANWKE